MPDSPPTKTRIQSRVIALLGASVIWAALVLALAELGTRASELWGAKRNTLVQEEVMRRVAMMAAFDSTLWEIPWDSYRPNAEETTNLEGKPFQIRINAQGYRGRDVSIPKPAGRYRIVCVGASTTVEGRTNETTYPALLEARLRRELASDSIEVVNCGVSSFTSQKELSHLSKYLSFQPDLIIEYGVINDVSALLPRLIRSNPGWKKLLLRSHFIARVTEPLLSPSAPLFRERIRVGTIANLERLADSVRAAGADIAFCSFATPHPRELNRQEAQYLDWDLQSDWEGQHIGLRTYSHYIRIYNEELQAMCARRGFPYLPVAEQMSGEMADFVDYCHMTERGIEAKASIIAAELRRQIPRLAKSELGDPPPTR